MACGTKTVQLKSVRRNYIKEVTQIDIFVSRFFIFLTALTLMVLCLRLVARI
jgi:hypothetical protein